MPLIISRIKEPVQQPFLCPVAKTEPLKIKATKSSAAARTKNIGQLYKTNLNILIVFSCVRGGEQRYPLRCGSSSSLCVRTPVGTLARTRACTCTL